MVNLVSQSTAENMKSIESFRIHTSSYSLLWILNGLFYLFMWLGLLWSSIETLPVRLVIPLGSSELNEADLVVLGFLSFWALRVVLRGRIPSLGMNWQAYSIILLLIIPFFIGLAVAKPVIIALRDVRVPIYYATILPMLDVLRKNTDLQRLKRLIVISGFVSMITSIGLWFISQPNSTSDSSPQRYGISSLNVAGNWLLFLAVASILFGDIKLSSRWRIGVVIILGLIQTYIANDSRSIYAGTFGGLLFLVGTSWFKLRWSLSARGLRQQWFKWKIIAFGTLISLVFLTILIGIGLVWSGLDIRDTVSSNMVLRRFYSLVDPTIEGYGSQNRSDRLLSVSYGLELGLTNYGLGLGYGDNPFVNLDADQIYWLIQRNRIVGNPGNIVEGLLFFHNSFGWAFARLGFWLSIGYFFLVLVFIVRAWNAAWKTRESSLRVMLFGTLAFVVYTLLFGFGGGGFFNYFGPGMILWLIALSVLVRGVALVHEG